jgi:hypothetical protein
VPIPGATAQNPPIFDSGAISLGNYDAAIENYVSTSPHSGDTSSFYTSPPVAQGTSKVVDIG